MVRKNSKVHYSAGSLFLFLLTINRSILLAEIRWSVYISKSQRILCVSFSKTDSGFCIYHLAVRSNFNFLHSSQWIPFLSQSCLVLNSLCAILRNTLIIWLMVSSLSPHNEHISFYSFESFSHQCLLRVSHWGLSNSKSHQFSRTLLSIQADLNNAIVFMVTSRLLISKSSSPCTNLLVTLPNALITIGITCHSFFFSFQIRSRYYLSFLSVSPCGQPGRQSPLFGRFSFICCLSQDLVIWPRSVDSLVPQNPSTPRAFFTKAVRWWKNITQERFDRLTTPAHWYTYLYTPAGTMKICPRSVYKPPKNSSGQIRHRRRHRLSGHTSIDRVCRYTDLFGCALVPVAVGRGRQT